MVFAAPGKWQKHNTAVIVLHVDGAFKVLNFYSLKLNIRYCLMLYADPVAGAYREYCSIAPDGSSLTSCRWSCLDHHAVSDTIMVMILSYTVG